MLGLTLLYDYTALSAAMRYILIAESYTKRGARRKTLLHNSGKRCTNTNVIASTDNQGWLSVEAMMKIGVF